MCVYVCVRWFVCTDCSFVSVVVCVFHLLRFVCTDGPLVQEGKDGMRLANMRRELVLMEQAALLRLWDAVAEHSMHLLVVTAAAIVANGTWSALGPIPPCYLVLAITYWRLSATGRRHVAAWVTCGIGFALQAIHISCMCWLRAIAFARPLSPSACVLGAVGWMMKGFIFGLQEPYMSFCCHTAFGAAIVGLQGFRHAFVYYTLPQEATDDEEDGWLISAFILSPIWSCGIFVVAALVATKAQRFLQRRVCTCSSIAHHLELEAYKDDSEEEEEVSRDLLGRGEAADAQVRRSVNPLSDVDPARGPMIARPCQQEEATFVVERTAVEPTVCSICLDAYTSHAFIPCGHRCVCAKCASIAVLTASWPRCPLCRSRATSVVKIFG